MVLWEIFHRQLPFNGRDPLAVAVEVVKLGLRPVIDSNIPTRVANLISECWHQDPNKRPPLENVMSILRDMSIETSSSTSFDDITKTQAVQAPTGMICLVHTVRNYNYTATPLIHSTTLLYYYSHYNNTTTLLQFLTLVLGGCKCCSILGRLS